MARMEDYVQFVETIVERVAERVKNNHAEVLAETKRSLWDMEHTTENGVSYMATRTKLEQIMTKTFTNRLGLCSVHRRTYCCIYCGCKRCINVFPSYVRCIAHQQRYRTGKGVHSSGSQSGNS